MKPSSLRTGTNTLTRRAAPAIGASLGLWLGRRRHDVSLPPAPSSLRAPARRRKSAPSAPRSAANRNAPPRMRAPPRPGCVAAPGRRPACQRRGHRVGVLRRHQQARHAIVAPRPGCRGRWSPRPAAPRRSLRRRDAEPLPRRGHREESRPCRNSGSASCSTQPRTRPPPTAELARHAPRARVAPAHRRRCAARPCRLALPQRRKGVEQVRQALLRRKPRHRADDNLRRRARAASVGRENASGRRRRARP